MIKYDKILKQLYKIREIYGSFQKKKVFKILKNQFQKKKILKIPKSVDYVLNQKVILKRYF